MRQTVWHMAEGGEQEGDTAQIDSERGERRHKQWHASGMANVRRSCTLHVEENEGANKCA